MYLESFFLKPILLLQYHIDSSKRVMTQERCNKFNTLLLEENIDATKSNCKYRTQQDTTFDFIFHVKGFIEVLMFESNI